jgi:ATP-dependent DNA helicase RecG
MKLYENNDIPELLNAPEGEHFEFKEAKKRFSFTEAVKYCCALANCGGGKLVLGVTDKRPRRVVGSGAFEQPERTRKGLIEKLRVMVKFQQYNYEDMRVLVFEVASRPIGLPIQVDGIVWWRDADGLVPMPQELVKRIYAESGHDFSGDICRDISLIDLDNNAIKQFRKRWREFSGNKRISTLSEEQLLRDSGVLVDDGLTYAALILFGKRSVLSRKLPQAEVIFEYRSSEAAGPAAQREEFQDGFFNNYDKVWELISLRNDNQHYQEGFHVLPVPTFNEQVARESLLNAVSHRDYQLGGSIFVRQYSRKLVFESPGGFPAGINVNNILDNQSPRNNLIAKVFQLCGLVERAGQGMNLIFEQAIKEAKPLPDFTGSDDYFVKLTLNGQVYDPKMLALVKKTSEESLEKMTFDDYYLLSIFYIRKTYDEIHLSRFKHLVELGIVNITERGIELVGNGRILLTDDNDLHIVEDSFRNDKNSDRLAIDSDKTAIDSDKTAIKLSDRISVISEFLEQNGRGKNADFVNLLNLSPQRVREITKKMTEVGYINKHGDKKSAYYTLNKTNS